MTLKNSEKAHEKLAKLKSGCFTMTQTAFQKGNVFPWGSGLFNPQKL